MSVLREAFLDTVSNHAWSRRLNLLQPVRGYRAGMDAFLLAAGCQPRPGQRVIEAGCGAGTALLCAAVSSPGALFTGVERDPAMLDLAQRNIAGNGLSERVEALPGDVDAGFRATGLKPFDIAMANPPFFDDPATMRAPAAEKTGAWMADGGLGAWVQFLLKAVVEGGVILMIHRADRLGDILEALAPKAGSVQILPVAPFADEPAKRVLVRAVKTGKAPLQLLPPLVLHQRADGRPATAQADALLTGQAPVTWRP